MPKRTFKHLFVFLMSLLSMSACQRQYGHLTSRHADSKTRFQSGHVVISKPLKKQESRVSENSKNNHVELAAESEFSKANPVSVQQTAFKSKTGKALISDKDSTKNTSHKIEKSVGKWTPYAFAAIAAANIGYFLLPIANELFAVVLISIGALAFTYLLTMLFRSMRDTRIRPYKPKYQRADSVSYSLPKLKKGFGLFTLVGALSLVLSIPLFAVEFYGIAVFLALLGTVCLFAGIIVGLVYLILSA